MGTDFCTTRFSVQTTSRNIDVDQALIYVVELND